MSQPIGTPVSTTATSQWKRLISFENRVRMLSIAWAAGQLTPLEGTPAGLAFYWSLSRYSPGTSSSGTSCV